MRYLWAILGVAIGAFIVVKSEWFYQNFGTVNWAEQHLGAEGGSRLFYKLVGLAIILLSFLLVSGLLESIFWSIFGRLFGFAGG